MEIHLADTVELGSREQEGALMSKHVFRAAHLLFLCAVFCLFSGCGVSKSALELADRQRQVTAAQLSDSADKLPTDLQQQAEFWAEFSEKMNSKELFGIMNVPESAKKKASLTAAVAKQAATNAPSSSEADNRRLLTDLSKKWDEFSTLLSNPTTQPTP
jgi:hypothetical protein